MIHLRNWNDLSRYGIKLLTGEACTLALRGLFDVTERGKALLQNFFQTNDWKMTLQLPRAWNHGHDDDPHVGAIMLPYELSKPLAAFILATAERQTVKMIVIHPTEGVFGLTNDEEIESAQQRVGHYFPFVSGDWERCRVFWNPCHLTDSRYDAASGRNVHQMTGRIK